MARKRRRSIVVPKYDTKPEQMFRNLVIKTVVPDERYMSNEAFHTRFRNYPVFPDVKFLSIPLIVEVKGVRWHSSKRMKKKDASKEACYVGEGFYCFTVTDTLLFENLKYVITRFKEFVEEMKRENFENPRILNLE